MLGLSCMSRDHEGIKMSEYFQWMRGGLENHVSLVDMREPE